MNDEWARLTLNTDVQRCWVTLIENGLQIFWMVDHRDTDQPSAADYFKKW